MAGASSWKSRDIGTRHNKTDPSNEPINGENETKEHLKKDEETQVKPVRRITVLGKEQRREVKQRIPKETPTSRKNKKT